MAKKEELSDANAYPDNSLIGTAGVHYAAYKFTRRGLLALPTVRNTPGTDIVVTDPSGAKHANIQVKTSHYGRAKFWIICSAKKFRKLHFGPNDYYVLLRPRRVDDPVEAEASEFEGFMLTAQEAREEMGAHLRYWEEKGKEPKFSLCIYVDKGPREKKWKTQDGRLLPNRKEKWRQRWQTWKL